MKPRYLKMLAGMSENGGSKEWTVYVACCSDGTLYTGITKDVDARLSQHNAGKGAAYTRTRRPVRLVHTENSFTRSQALVREAEIKRMPRPKKLELAQRALARC